MPKSRRENAYETRVAAADVAKASPPVTHRNNGEENKYRRTKGNEPCQTEPSYIANFTKGLPHDPETGLLLNPADYQQFVKGIRSGDTSDFEKTPLGPGKKPVQSGCLSRQDITCETADRAQFWISDFARGYKAKDCNPATKGAPVRAWESQGAGLIYELEGPDSHAVTMPPAPRLDSVELAAEMAEDYLMALLRDVHFSQLRDPALGEQCAPPGGKYCEECRPQLTVDEAINILPTVQVDGRNWFMSNCCELTDEERARHRGTPDLQHIFRGITPGEDKGPYLSQFLLVGNANLGAKPTCCVEGKEDPNKVFGGNLGFIAYGAQRVDQRVRVAEPCKDYMTTFEAWLDVQNGADMRGAEDYVPFAIGNREFPGYRVITTPRDLATYVHHDALYQAYLNACLIMLGMGVPFDPDIPFQGPDVQDKQQAFASFGGPHILTLVTEVATRALKAVRHQKFNIHRRLRPEAVAGLIDRYLSGVNPDGELEPITPLVKALDNAGVLRPVVDHNACQNSIHGDRQADASAADKRFLLPMAFPEGSPMHPAYGAGHATVAGACVTILKAFFDHGFELRYGNGKPFAFEPNKDGSGLEPVRLSEALTVEGELNKLAANISIGRNWAGVHYFTDYIESMRMGEKIALGILEEQKLTYGENFSMSVPLFDGSVVQI